MYRRKTVAGSPDPMHANGTDKPCIVIVMVQAKVPNPQVQATCSDLAAILYLLDIQTLPNLPTAHL